MGFFVDMYESREDDGDENGMMFAVLGCIVGGNFGAFVGVIENSTKRFVVSSICGRLLQSKYSGGCCDTMQDVCTIQSVKEEILEYTPGYRSSAHRIPLLEETGRGSRIHEIVRCERTSSEIPNVLDAVFCCFTYQETIPTSSS